MKCLCQTKYAPHLMLLGATCKTTEYAPLLFFVTVSFQVVGVVVVPEETNDIVKKVLEIIRDWDPVVPSKFGVIDFDKMEINALEELFPDIEVFICSFHHEKSWTRWTNKYEDYVSHIADNAKCHHHRIVDGSSRKELDKSIEGFLLWKHFTGKALIYWLRWDVYFCLNQLIMLINTNIVTEPLNRELKMKGGIIKLQKNQI